MYTEKRARKLSLFVSFFLPIIIAALLTACGAGGGGGGKTESNTTTGIGPNGGTVTSSDGRAKVVIPAGAITSAANITVETVSNKPSGNIGIAFKIVGMGTTFSQPVTISVAYDEASLPSGVEESDLKLGTVLKNKWKALSNSTVDTTANVVSGTTTHLSIYGILAVSRRDAVIHATSGASLLKMVMRDPDSFKLESAKVTDDTGAVCYQYRAKNGFGGMNRGQAVLTTDGNFKTNEMDGFTKLWNKECVGKSGTEAGDAVRQLLAEYDPLDPLH